MAVSQRLVELWELLGCTREIDIVWMCTREPSLLTAPHSSLLSRLMDMKLSSSGNVTSVLQIVEHQPTLLIQRADAADLCESPDEQIPAWESGLLTDQQDEWNRRFTELSDYYKEYGDAHVGFREADSQLLTRWCEKQRKAAQSGCLSGPRLELLEGLDFCFNREEAEWMRWFNELCICQQVSDSVIPMALADGKNLELINWCSVQRVARKTGMLSAKKIALLDSANFNWTAADALS